MSTTSVNGVQLYHESTGTGERLVLTHGSWTDGSGWSPAIAALAGRGALEGLYEVVTWDRRGYSRSTPGDHPGSRDEDAEDLAGLIAKLGGGPVHLVGNSYGAIIVLTVVATQPELVASAMVQEPPLLTLPGSAAARSAQSATERDLRVVLGPDRIGRAPGESRALHRRSGLRTGLMGTAPRSLPDRSREERADLPRRGARPHRLLDRR